MTTIRTVKIMFINNADNNLMCILQLHNVVMLQKNNFVSFSFKQSQSFACNSNSMTVLFSLKIWYFKSDNIRHFTRLATVVCSKEVLQMFLIDEIITASSLLLWCILQATTMAIKKQWSAATFKEVRKFSVVEQPASQLGWSTLVVMSINH